MNAQNKCEKVTNFFDEKGDTFVNMLKELINSGHLTIFDVNCNQQIVIKIEKEGGN